jgi:hypothetical protein
MLNRMPDQQAHGAIIRVEASGGHQIIFRCFVPDRENRRVKIAAFTGRHKNSAGLPLLAFTDDRCADFRVIAIRQAAFLEVPLVKSHENLRVVSRISVHNFGSVSGAISLVNCTTVKNPAS